jgi:cobalt transporter subunit CbtA
MIRRVLLVAILAGLAAGMVETLVQLTRITPLILSAESYETISAAADQTWTPAPGFERGAYLALASFLTAIGFGMLLSAAFVLHGGPVGLGRGVVWGLAGFAIFWLAPAIGLPPELPGAKAAPLLDRQFWYLGTVVASGAGLAILVFVARWLPRIAGAALIAAPHIIGAPHLVMVAGNAPPEMAAMFVTASLFAALALWVVLGGVGGYLFDRFAKAAQSEADPTTHHAI